VIKHIVSWKLNGEDAAARSESFTALAQALGALPAVIPEIHSLSIGQDLDETDGNWDAVLVVDYASTADLATYQSHPEHVKAAAIVRAHTGERAVVDFEY
jgi:hypothetical protein